MSSFKSTQILYMQHLKVLKFVWVFILFFLTIGYHIIVCPSAHCSEYQKLQKRYVEIQNQLHDNRFGLPIYIESFDKDHILTGHVYSIISHPFSRVKNALLDPANWCDIALLHLNIKACTYQNQDNRKKITIYTGRKFYQPPEDAFVLDYNFQVIENKKHYFNILLTAEDGPLDTSDYRIVLEALPIRGHKTFMQFSYTYKYGLITQASMEGYFATLGSDKIGFSITQKDENNEPVFINGTRGAIERNSVRYYFAFQAYLDTLRLTEENRFEQRIQLWYSLTDQFKEQLFELPREDYIHFKLKEHQNQVTLQKKLDQSIHEQPKKKSAHRVVE